MRASRVLFFYVGRQFLANFIMLLVMFMGIVFLFDFVEMLRRTASKADISIGLTLEMTLLKLPFMGQQIFPFAVLFGGMLCFWRLTRSHELVVTRAAGVSAWQFLAPVLLIATLLGVIQVAVSSPFSSVMLSRYERLESRFMKGQDSFLAISPNGLWLRQAGQAVIHAEHVLQQGVEVELREVTIFSFQGSDRFVARYEAEVASLEDGFWRLSKVWRYAPEEQASFSDEEWFETDLTINRIQDSFSPPETMSFWDLPAFIDTLENAGFSAIRHRLHLHSLLATPLLLCAMVLIAATFTLRQSRKGGTVYVVSGGVLTGFLLYFFSDVVFALGLSDSIPVVLAA
ncbi:MAG: LPS export ABC transporter permease LptG, partial [Rhodospirillales bacterium]|nr:LPS export ABC transporter permease LptG [Rhodospirillales bacterium]